MKIVIDLQSLQNGSRLRGIGRYTCCLTKAILRNPQGHDIFLLINGMLSEEAIEVRLAFKNEINSDHILTFFCPKPVREHQAGNDERRIIGEYLYQEFIEEQRPDILFIPSYFEGYGDDAIISINRRHKSYKVVCALHDLIPLVQQEQYLESDLAYKKYYLRKLEEYKSSDAWLAVSEFSRNEASLLTKIPKEYIYTVYNACSENFNSGYSENEEEVLTQNGITYQYILYVGGGEPRKNLLRLLEALAKAKTEFHDIPKLVIAGYISDGELSIINNKLESLGLGKDFIKNLSYVSDGILATLYRNCQLFIFPSIHEGFGIPALESVKSGAIVAAANNTSLPEVLGSPETYFNPYDIDDIKNVVVKNLQDKVLRERNKLIQLENSKKFSWEASAAKALAIFENLCQGSFENKDPQQYKHPIEAAQQLRQKCESFDKIDEKDKIALSWAIISNHPPPTRQRLLIDVSEVIRTDAGTGIQRVVKKRLEFIFKEAKQYTPCLIYADETDIGYRHAGKYQEKLTGIQCDHPDGTMVEPTRGDFFLGLDYNSHIQIFQRPFYNFLKVSGIPVSFVLHDILPYTNPEWFTTDVENLKNHWSDYLHTLSNADVVFCVSQNTAHEFRKWLKENNTKSQCNVEVVYNGSEISKSNAAEILNPKELDILSSFSESFNFLMVGTIEPRKDHELVIDALSKIWQEDSSQISLIIVGKEGWMVERVIDKIQNHDELNKRLFWLTGISDAFLSEIYKKSHCLVAASKGEGFGLPIVEAAHYKIPVIARDIPVFREVGGNYAHFFDADDPEHLSNILAGLKTKFSTDYETNYNNVISHSWDETSGNLLIYIDSYFF